MRQLPMEGSTSPVVPARAIVILTSKESVAASIQSIITSLGGRPVTVSTPMAFVDAMDRDNPVLALIDLDTPGELATAIARSKSRPHTRAIPIYAFGEEVAGAVRQAGIDAILSPIRFWTALPWLVKDHLQPSVYYPEGWDDVLPRVAQVGLLEFNAGRYFEQHEYLEKAWRDESRPIRTMYQGILQVGVAFLQIQRGNWRGALKMFRRGLPRLRNLPAVCQGVQVGKFRAAAEAIHEEISMLGPAHLADFDQARFPQIEFNAVDQTASADPHESYIL